MLEEEKATNSDGQKEAADEIDELEDAEFFENHPPYKENGRA